MMDQSGRGFTLLELVVAIALLAVVSALGYTSLRYLQSSASNAEDHLENLRRLQIAVGVFERDLRNVARRPVSVGLAMRRASVVGTASDLELTRGGVTRVTGSGASGLVRVGYRFRDGQLNRHVWNVLDRPTDVTLGRSRLLIDGLTSASFRYASENGSWLDEWQVEPAAAWPRAVELKLTSPRLGNVRRLIVLN